MQISWKDMLYKQRYKASWKQWRACLLYYSRVYLFGGVYGRRKKRNQFRHFLVIRHTLVVVSCCRYGEVGWFPFWLIWLLLASMRAFWRSNASDAVAAFTLLTVSRMGSVALATFGLAPLGDSTTDVHNHCWRLGKVDIKTSYHNVPEQIQPTGLYEEGKCSAYTVLLCNRIFEVKLKMMT